MLSFVIIWYSTLYENAIFENARDSVAGPKHCEIYMERKVYALKLLNINFIRV
jgi:hypothetical protein